MSREITVEGADLVVELFADLLQYPQELSRALNTARRDAKREGSKAFREASNVKAAPINRRIVLGRNASANFPMASVKIIDKKLIAKHFTGTRARKKSGVRFEPFPGQVTTIASGFQRTSGRAGRARFLVREDAPGGGLVGRLPIRPIFGPSPVEIFDRNPVIFQRMKERAVQTATREGLRRLARIVN